ncbi:hypothetical protein Pfra02_02690 [Pseudomonas fragi]|nr:hypothetical protein Pfra02_02690 [Pseudomonas fragi]
MLPWCGTPVLPCGRCYFKTQAQRSLNPSTWRFRGTTFTGFTIAAQLDVVFGNCYMNFDHYPVVADE